MYERLAEKLDNTTAIKWHQGHRMEVRTIYPQNLSCYYNRNSQDEEERSNDRL
ncbi:hypothetical protein MNQ98_16135 [Paenibacillus sp. N3/727]|uniref:hypothetical protein n=1 Tax=Paenibacillus sp. N3/727 TaxID=2925845 RepID=UPI001F536D1B|nr:hypothetical protein [Paenibacillus sp. N3/727]UNK16067.1 hypothetical protein MNQ98_16135 [Paenibacillus sp. N3/727]